MSGPTQSFDCGHPHTTSSSTQAYFVSLPGLCFVSFLCLEGWRRTWVTIPLSMAAHNSSSETCWEPISSRWPLFFFFFLNNQHTQLKQLSFEHPFMDIKRVHQFCRRKLQYFSHAKGYQGPKTALVTVGRRTFPRFLPLESWQGQIQKSHSGNVLYHECVSGPGAKARRQALLFIQQRKSIVNSGSTHASATFSLYSK